MSQRETIAERLFGEALELPREQRAVFLDRVCAGQPAVRRMVEDLLDENDRLSGFLSAPVCGSPPTTTATAASPAVAVGTRLLERYLIVERLGAGGMGVVYRARDEKLEREVAIKMLQPGVLTGEEARSRFRREARALAKLNHAHIAAVHDVIEQDGADFIVMELVAGESLSAKLRGDGALPVKEATAIALQVAEALEEAHEQGVIHRDLKPANVMITPKGQVKVLDFGLAKLMGPTDATQTAESAVMGTPLYMSPEQAIGQKADVRSDLWSLGVTYYESLAGVTPFKGTSSLAILRAITDAAPPPLHGVRADAPLLSEQIVERALEKDPELRYQHARDFATDLRRVMRDLEPGGMRLSRSETAGVAAGVGGGLRRNRLVLWGAVLGGVLVAAALAILLTPARVTGPLDSTQITFSGDDKQGPLLTDGSRLYFQSRNIPSEMAVSGGMIAPIPGLSSGMYLVDTSPDGSKVLVWMADLNDETGRGWLLVGSSLGGTWRKITSHTANQFARWSPDGKSIYFADDHQIWVMDEDGGNARALWKPPGEPGDLELSPDGKLISVTLTSSLWRLWQVGTDGHNPRPLELDWPAEANEAYGLWTPDGRHFVFNSSREGRGNIYEVLSPRWFEFWKKPEAVRITGNQVNTTDAAPARDSRSLFVLGRLETGMSLVFDPRIGKLVPFLGGLSALQFVISPDRQWMAYTEYPSGRLWKSRLDGSEAIQLTDTAAYMLQWSPDGKWIAYSDGNKIYRISADGGAPEKLMQSGEHEVMPTWFPDGNSIAFNRFNGSDNPDGMYVVDLASRKVTPMAGAEKYYVAAWAPDGKYLVAIARDPLRMMIYTATTKQWRELRRFDAPWGFYAWTPDSRYIYFSQTQTLPGMYRLSVPSGEWERISDIPNMGSVSDAYVSVTVDGQPAVMNHTGVAQIYSLQWK
jgi:serine/threonine protein kinase